MPVVEGERLLALFPHRFENVLLDRADCPLVPGGTAGSASVRLAEGDKQGRDIFLYRHAGEWFLISPAACEFVALASICVLKPDLDPAEICFFSTISNVQFAGRVAVAGGLSAAVTRHKDRGPFKRFSGVVTGTGGRIAECEIMAYALKPGAETDATSGGKRSTPPEKAMNEPVDKRLFDEKSPAMVFADAVTAYDAAASVLTTRYTYPASHPLTKGHFPGNPVMMGILQWTAVEDAARLLAARAALTGEVAFSAEILRPDGTLIADVKDLVLAFGDGPPLTKSLSRIGFRGMVKPLEEIYIRVRVRGE